MMLEMIVFSLMIIIIWGNNPENEGFDGNALTHIEADPVSKQILEKLFSEEPSANLMKVYHLVFNSLL